MTSAIVLSLALSGFGLGHHGSPQGPSLQAPSKCPPVPVKACPQVPVKACPQVPAKHCPAPPAKACPQVPGKVIAGPSLQGPTKAHPQH